MGNPRVILFVTGTRADFGKLKPLMYQVEQSPEFECRVFVTGMHMLARFGSTVNEVLKAGFSSVHTYINQDGSAPCRMDVVLGDTIHGFAHYLREFRPDLIVVHGDRVEALAGATVGALNDILVAHVEGGELSGTVDELIRHAVSKLSHLHFVANTEAAGRLEQLGELPESIFAIGSPDIDVMLSESLPSLDEVRRHYEIPFREFGIALYHPVTSELDRTAEHASALVEALARAPQNFVVIHPNNDHGSESILEALARLAGRPDIRLLPSMRFEAFLTLLRHARVIIGNSSAGIREAPVYGVPTINLGSRQQNRFAYQSILHLPEDADLIVETLARLPERFAPSGHFGDGQSRHRFMAALRLAAFWNTPRQKQFRDLAPTLRAGPSNP
jgi:UDP-N-acetylglucosamine 2-epimerase (hydrolysing)